MQEGYSKQAKKHVIGSLVFLFLSFPLGLLFFIITVTGLSVGIGTLILWIGLPLIFLTLWLVRGMAEVERRLITSLLDIPIPAPSPLVGRKPSGFLGQFVQLLRDPLTWTATVYMLIKLPLGVVNFTVGLVMSLVSACLALMPVIYMVNLFINAILWKAGVTSQALLIPGFIEVQHSFDFVYFTRTFLVVPVGIVGWLISRVVFDVLARISGELGKALLGGNILTAQPHQAEYSSRYPQQEIPVYVD